jgi:hypothetical protein
MLLPRAPDVQQCGLQNLASLPGRMLAAAWAVERLPTLTKDAAQLLRRKAAE